MYLAEWTGLEPATPGVTGRYSNQLNYHSILTYRPCNEFTDIKGADSSRIILPSNIPQTLFYDSLTHQAGQHQSIGRGQRVSFGNDIGTRFAGELLDIVQILAEARHQQVAQTERRGTHDG